MAWLAGTTKTALPAVIVLQLLGVLYMSLSSGVVIVRHLPAQAIGQLDHEQDRKPNMTEEIFLYASNIHVTSKQRTEFTFLTMDTLEKITRGAGDKLNAEQQHIEKINRLANSPNSLLFCPSFQKLKAKKKQGRPRKQAKIEELTQNNDIFTTTETNYESLSKHYEELLATTPRKEKDESTQSPSLGDILQNAPLLGRKRHREVEPHVDRGTFMEEIAASFMNEKEVKLNNLTTIEHD